MFTRLETGAPRLTRITSSALDVLTTLAHPLAETGEYAVTVMQHDEHVASFDVLVAEECTAAQVNVDLAYLSLDRAPTLHLRPGGSIVSYVTKGAGGYAIRVRRLGDPDQHCSYDSRNLQTDDLFVATPLRAGRYELSDRQRRQGVTVQVAPNPPAHFRYAPPPPAQIRLTEHGFDRTAVEVGFSQGIAVRVEVPHACLVIAGPHDL